MNTQFVKAVFDLYCNWEGLPPTYRIYVNGELFSERTWIWGHEKYLQQTLQIQGPPGMYRVHVESVGPNLAEFYTNGHDIEHGSAHWINRHRLEILDESV